MQTQRCKKFQKAAQTCANLLHMNKSKAQYTHTYAYEHTFKPHLQRHTLHITADSSPYRFQNQHRVCVAKPNTVEKMNMLTLNYVNLICLPSFLTPPQSTHTHIQKCAFAITLACVCACQSILVSTF